MLKNPLGAGWGILPTLQWVHNMTTLKVAMVEPKDLLKTGLKGCDIDPSTHPFVASEVAMGIAHTTNGQSRSNCRSSKRNH